ncbi:BON domain-containing protein [Flaviflagellibacter deserti]|uniref:BON domain-containing protein n=1 Tax=Flaviflagellibacter deserti TaxID=2267266 RepID=A0ABV9YZC0_9HYPH
MADRDRWNDDLRSEWSRRRPGGERDFYRRDERSEDDYGRGYGEEGLTNYRARSPRGVSASGEYGSSGYRRYGSYDRDDDFGGPFGRSDYGRGVDNSDWGRGEYGRNLGGPRESSYGYRSDYDRARYGRDFGYGNEFRSDWSNRGGFNRDRDRFSRDEDRGLWDRASDEVASWFGSEEAERRRREDARQDMRHQGRGPKSYRRSDDRIREDINDRLTDDPFIDASEIDVKVSSAEVTLSGTVENRLQRRRAEDIAERISGVNHVQNNLRVSQTEERLSGSSQASSTSGVSATTTGSRSSS